MSDRQGGFAASVAAWAEATNQAIDDCFREVVIELGASVIRMSPVGNPDDWKSSPPPGYVGGRFRANWQFSIDTPSQGVIEAEDTTGALTIAKIEGDSIALKAGQTAYIVNNLPYGIRLEYEHHSKQAPNGMVRITLNRFQQLVEDAIRNNKV